MSELLKLQPACYLETFPGTMQHSQAIKKRSQGSGICSGLC